MKYKMKFLVLGCVALIGLASFAVVADDLKKEHMSSTPQKVKNKSTDLNPYEGEGRKLLYLRDEKAKYAFGKVWVAQAVTDAFNLLLLTRERDIKKIKPYFSDDGWAAYERALKENGMLKESEFVNEAFKLTITKIPLIINAVSDGNDYKTVYEIPSILTYRIKNQRKSERKKIVVTVSHKEPREYGIGIKILDIKMKSWKEIERDSVLLEQQNKYDAFLDEAEEKYYLKNKKLKKLFIRNWVVQALSNTFSFSYKYKSYMKYSKDIKKYFSKDGIYSTAGVFGQKYASQIMEEKGIYKLLVTATPILRDEGRVGRGYRYIYEVPVTISYKKDEQETVKEKKIIVQVDHILPREYAKGIEITKIYEGPYVRPKKARK